MRDFLFLRHGETDWNRDNRLQGQIQDVQLNETGLKQARDAASLLAGVPFDLIVSSTLDRAVTTARMIAEKKGVPLLFDKRLIERGCGVAEGKTCREAGVESVEAFFNSYAEGAETKEELERRACEAISDLMSRYPGKRILLVAHGAWLRAMARKFIGKDMIFSNAIPYIASETDAGWTIKRLDER